LLISGCARFSRPAEPDIEITIEEAENQTAEEEPAAEEAAAEEEPAAEEETPQEAAEEKNASAREPAKYIEPEAAPSKEEAETCGCSFTWEPLCGKDGKTYINRCLYRCFGNALEDIKSNGQCPKKESPIRIYTDDVEKKYEADKWNGGYCWRQMYRESGIRYCKNMIINGRVNTEPTPAKGNWLDDSHLVMDRQGRKDSLTIKLSAGEQATNEEYDVAYQPLFETGRYKLSFWARQDIAANNDWRAKLTLKDWWESKPRPVGVEGCYKVATEINADEVFMEEEPTEWRHYHYEFDVPINVTQWDSMEKTEAECAEWDMIPRGYGITITGPTVGYALFDDFVLEKVK
jgi:hypothetical protein